MGKFRRIIQVYTSKVCGELLMTFMTVGTFTDHYQLIYYPKKHWLISEQRIFLLGSIFG